MNVLYLSKHKRSAARALETLVNRGCEVRAVVVPPPTGDEHPSQRTDLAAQRLGLALVAEEEAYALAGEADLAVSFLYPRLITEPLISGPRIGCLNFHPAPLPDMRGVGGYNVAVLEGFTEWGVSAHFVDESFDTGDLVEVRRFAIDPAAETAWSLDLRSQDELLDVFRGVVDTLLRGEDLPREPQGAGRYVSREDLEEMRETPLRCGRPGDRAAHSGLLVPALARGHDRAGRPHLHAGGRAPLGRRRQGAAKRGRSPVAAP